MLKTTLFFLLTACYVTSINASEIQHDISFNKNHLASKVDYISKKLKLNSFTKTLIRGKYRHNIDFLPINFNKKNIIENSYFEMNYKKNNAIISYNYSVKF